MWYKVTIELMTFRLSVDCVYNSNNISEVDQLGYLALCTSLMSLTLEGNPLSITLAETKVCTITT